MNKYWQAAQIAFLLVAVSAGVRADETLKFAHRMPAVNDFRTTHVQKKTVMNLTVTIDGTGVQPVQRTETSDIEKRTVVLGVSSNMITKARVIYIKYQEEGNPDTEANGTLVTGRSYVIQGQPGALTVTDDKGGAVADAERAVVLDDNDDVSRPQNLAPFLDGKVLKIGDTLDVPDEVSHDLFAADEQHKDVSVHKFTLTLNRIEKRGTDSVGVFAVNVEMTVRPDSGTTVTGSLSGELAINSATGWPLEAHLSGPLTVSGQHVQDGHIVRVTGSATMSLQTNASYGTTAAGDKPA